MEVIRILARPKSRNLDSDPGNHYLYEEIERQGACVVEWNLCNLLFGHYHVVHIHWPDNILKTTSCVAAALKLVFFYLFLLYFKYVKRVRLVWTAHNIVSHEERYPFLEKVLWTVMLKRVSGIIFHEEAIRDQFYKIRGQLDCLSTVVKLPMFCGMYPGAEKTKSGVNFQPVDGNPSFLFIGQIRPYKNVKSLIVAFKGLPLSGSRLVVAGKPINSEYERELEDLCSGDQRISFQPGFVPNSKLRNYFDKADLVVLPFSSISNSGSVLLALSFGCRVLVPRIPVFEQLQSEFGDGAVYLYDGDLESKDLEVCLVGKFGRTAEIPESRTVEFAASAHLNFYSSILSEV